MVHVLSSRILLRPTDLERSRVFYRDVLGLAIYREFDTDTQRGTVFFLGGGFLELSGGCDRPPDPEAVQLWLQVPDAAAAHAELAARGATIDRHVGVPQATHQVEHFDITCPIPAMPGRGALHLGEQTFTLVIPQSVQAQPMPTGHLSGGVVVGHGSQPEGWSALQVKSRPGFMRRAQHIRWSPRPPPRP